ncbi:protein sirB1 [Aquipluma nitroreducens]|uniref:Protein sirB1 n=1 Tax=Aquipluma nitroreducens TaxID=2010828 RepID=A0A5K7S4R8_9BACT|nr:transglutaminase-like domain-containing protein [Aquipluma nitroreducens]BBE16558.1 protein sirB1 [Aquipluma nitroreducens]
MNELKLDSLIKLLDDPDDSVFNLVLVEILKEDISIVDRLEHIWETSFEELVQQRIELIIQQIQLNDTKNKIKNWASQETLDLFEGIFLISRYQYPELKLKSIQIQLEKIRKDVWLEFKNSLTSLEKITILNHIFFDHYKFKINRDNTELPQNSYINRVLDTRRGNPISITIIYTLIARSLNLPVHYIDFDNNPLVGYFDKDMARLVNEEGSNSQILFYINPSNKGAIIGPKEVDYLRQSAENQENNHQPEPCPDRIVIKRLVEKLSYDYKQAGLLEKVNYLKEIAEIL